MSLKLYRYPSRSPNWIVRGVVRGKPFGPRTTGTSDKDAAEQIRIRWESEQLEESIHGRRATVTFMEAAASYLEDGGSPRFLGTEDRTTGKWTLLLGELGQTRLSHIDSTKLSEAAKRLYPDARPDTINRQVYTPFVAIWNHAAERGWCDYRKWSRPRNQRGTRIRAKAARVGSFPVPYERAAKFVTAMWPLDAITMTVLFYTGMRPIEWFHVEDKDVDVDGRWITIPSSKTGEGRGVPMHDVLVPIMRALVDRFEGPIANRFNTETATIEPYPIMENAGGQLGKAINAARAKTNIRDISAYTARHTVNTNLTTAGVLYEMRARIMGHARRTTNDIYIGIPQADLIKAVNLLPVPALWKTSEIVQNPCTVIDNVVKLQQEHSGKRGRLRPW